MGALSIIGVHPGEVAGPVQLLSPEVHMKRILLAAVVLLVACESPVTELRRSPPAPRAAVGGNGGCVIGGTIYPRGFNENGYNYCARNFVGKADGVDKMLDGKVWGDPTFANDHLVMKWNAEWDRGIDEGWAKPPYRAAEDNEWNGRRPDGSGYTEHFKAVWTAACFGKADGDLLPDGGYCIWGQFEALMDHGMDPNNTPYWLAKALPGGYGVAR